MPSFDVVSEVDMQEVRNALDQARREVTTRFDFKGTNSAVDLDDKVVTLNSATEDRLNALRQVIEEKLVKRKVSLKALDYGKVEEAAGGRARQRIVLVAGISLGEGPGHQPLHQGQGGQGHPEPDPGRPAPGHGQEARRPPGGHRRPQGRGLRHPAAVHQLP